MIEPDVVHARGTFRQITQYRVRLFSRLESGPTDLFIYATSATVDGTVLRGHDSLDRSFALHITCKPRKFWNDHNDL